jgi:hypothetical protein
MVVDGKLAGCCAERGLLDHRDFLQRRLAEAVR